MHFFLVKQQLTPMRIAWNLLNEQPTWPKFPRRKINLNFLQYYDITYVQKVHCWGTFWDHTMFVDFLFFIYFFQFIDKMILLSQN